MTASAWTSVVWEIVQQEFAELPDLRQAFRILLRLLVAAALGALLGYQRERQHKAAGLRTHILVTVGTAMIIVVAQTSGMAPTDLSRVIQGILTGIGFIGSGTILKKSDEKTIQGITTAATIWIAGALGIAAALGRIWSALLGALAAFLVLTLLGEWEKRISHNDESNRSDTEPRPPLQTTVQGPVSDRPEK
jgi:putative Mg2+ transporter-C (MgtC) family protein